MSEELKMDDEKLKGDMDKLWRDIEYIHPAPRIWVDGVEMTHAELEEWLDAQENRRTSPVGWLLLVWGLIAAIVLIALCGLWLAR